MNYAQKCLNDQIHIKKSNLDNKARFRCQVGYWFRLINVSIYGTTADADIQLSVFDSSALKKQFPIFKEIFKVRRGVK